MPNLLLDADMSTSKKKKAGLASGTKRAKLTKVRRFFVLSAFEKLKPSHRYQPYSSESIDALETEFRNPRRHDPFPQLEPPLEKYECVIDRSAPAPSGELEAMFDDVVNLLVHENVETSSIRHASRETLIKDLKALGIRTRRRKQ